MAVKGRFSLDTNILVYAVDRDAGKRRRTAEDLLGLAARRDCVLTLQALAGFYHATTRKGLLAPGRAGEFVRDWLAVFPVAAADEATLTEAMDAVAEHTLSFWDAMLWATARQAGCSAILSENMQDGRRLGGLEIVDPFGTGSGERLAAYLGD